MDISRINFNERAHIGKGSGSLVPRPHAPSHVSRWEWGGRRGQGCVYRYGGDIVSAEATKR